MSSYSRGHGVTPTIGYISTSIVYSCGPRLAEAIGLLYSRIFSLAAAIGCSIASFFSLTVAIGYSISAVWGWPRP